MATGARRSRIRRLSGLLNLELKHSIIAGILYLSLGSETGFLWNSFGSAFARGIVRERSFKIHRALDELADRRTVR